MEIVKSVERQGSNEERDEGCALWVDRPSNGQLPSNSRLYAYDPVLEASLYNASVQNSPVGSSLPAAACDDVEGAEDLASSSSKEVHYTTGSAEKTAQTEGNTAFCRTARQTRGDSQNKNNEQGRASIVTRGAEGEVRQTTSEPALESSSKAGQGINGDTERAQDNGHESRQESEQESGQDETRDDAGEEAGLGAQQAGAQEAEAQEEQAQDEEAQDGEARDEHMQEEQVEEVQAQEESAQQAQAREGSASEQQAQEGQAQEERMEVETQHGVQKEATEQAQDQTRGVNQSGEQENGEEANGDRGEEDVEEDGEGGGEADVEEDGEADGEEDGEEDGEADGEVDGEEDGEEDEILVRSPLHIRHANRPSAKHRLRSKESAKSPAIVGGNLKNALDWSSDFGKRSNRQATTVTPRTQLWKNASGTRRKRALSDVPQTPAKRHMPLVAPPGTMALNDLPEDLIKPEDALEHITSLLARAQNSSPQTLLNMFFGIASPFSINQLSEACSWIRDSVPRDNITEGTHVRRTVRALEWMDAQSKAFPYLRRFHLVQLCQHQRDLQGRHLERSSSNTGKPQKYGLKKGPIKTSKGTKRAASNALDELMRQAHPECSDKHDAEYSKRLKSLRNRLSAGRNWYLMQQRFGIGILALVPCGKEVGITNAEYVLITMLEGPTNFCSVEKTPQVAFTRFLEFLYKHRGVVLKEMSELISMSIYDVLQGRETALSFDFEGSTADELTRAQYDSPALVSRCRSERRHL